MRVLGLFPTEKEILETQKVSDPLNCGRIEMGDFFVQMARKFRDSGDIEMSCKNAFKKLSYSQSDNESIRLLNLQSLINSLTDETGEPLSTSELDAFIQSVPSEVNVKSGDGVLYGAEFERFLFANDIDSRKKEIKSKLKV
jgi:Ca2+-binding EF-hand superfamily protein